VSKIDSLENGLKFYILLVFWFIFWVFFTSAYIYYIKHFYFLVVFWLCCLVFIGVLAQNEIVKIWQF